MIEKGIGYLLDPSHPPLVFAAVRGFGEVLEHGLKALERSGRDVSPIIKESRHRIVVVNLYEPEPVCIEIVQHDGQLERMTEIIGAGFGLGVLRELRRTAKTLEVEPASLSERFRKRIVNERATYVEAFSLLKGNAAEKKARFGAVLRELQEKHRRDAGILDRRPPSETRSKPAPSFPLRLPEAVRELERSVGDVLAGSWDRAVLGRVAEIAAALAAACRAENLAEACGIARSITFLVSASPAELRAVEKPFREKLAALVTSLKRVTRNVLAFSGS